MSPCSSKRGAKTSRPQPRAESALSVSPRSKHKLRCPVGRRLAAGVRRISVCGGMGTSCRNRTVACARCGELIAPSERWHLDHADDRNSYLGPSHAKCNLQAAGWKTGLRMAGYPKHDPENGVFWGPPIENGQPRPWSKAWYDWRTERVWRELPGADRDRAGPGNARGRARLPRALGEIAAEAADVPAARFVDRRLAELDTRQGAEGPEPLLSAWWIRELGELMLSIRDGEPALNRTARDWANGVLTVLDDMRQRHPDAYSAKAVPGLNLTRRS